jgi:hypothetical protein
MALDTAEDLARRLARLEESLAALATDQRALHRQMAELVSLLEAAQERDLPAREDPPGPAAGGAAGMPSVGAGKGAPAGVGWRRGGRWIRGALALGRSGLRRLRAGREVAPGWPEDEIERVLAPGYGVRVPRLALLLEETPSAGLRAAFAAQSWPPYEIAWPAGEGEGLHLERAGVEIGWTRRAELPQALESEWVLRWPAGWTAEPAPTLLERLAWLVACEASSRFIEVWLERIPGDPASGRARAELWQRRDPWPPGGGARSSSSLHRGGVVGRAVRPGAPPGSLPLPEPRLGDSSPGGGDAGLRRVGDLLLARSAAPGRHRVLLRPLAPAGTPSASEDATRPAVALLLADPLTCGRERWLADLLAAQGDLLRLFVVALAIDGDLAARRLAALARAQGAVYPLPDLFPPLLWPSLLAHLRVRHGIGRAVGVGQGAALEELLAAWPVGSDPGTGVARVGTLACAPPAEAVPPPEARAAGRAPARERLGLPAGARVAAQVGDLVWERRPEDFAALAERFRDDPAWTFLWVGEGPLEPVLRDLVAWYGLERFHVAPASTALEDVLCAADVLVSTAEREPFPWELALGRASGLPVVAPGLPELASLREGASGLPDPAPGDVGALAAMLAAVATLDPPAALPLGELAAARARHVAHTRALLLGEEEGA